MLLSRVVEVELLILLSKILSGSIVLFRVSLDQSFFQLLLHFFG